MNSFANLLIGGAEDVDANPSSALELYERAMDEDGTADVINRFA